MNNPRNSDKYKYTPSMVNMFQANLISDKIGNMINDGITPYFEKISRSVSELEQAMARIAEEQRLKEEAASAVPSSGKGKKSKADKSIPGAEHRKDILPGAGSLKPDSDMNNIANFAFKPKDTFPDNNPLGGSFKGIDVSFGNIYKGLHRLENSNFQNWAVDGLFQVWDSAAGFTFWSGNGTRTAASEVSNDLLPGGFSMYFSAAGQSQAQVVTLLRPVDTVYNMSFYVKTDNSAQVTLAWNDSAATTETFNYNYATNTKVAQEIASPVNGSATSCTITLKQINSGATYFSEFMLSEGESLPPYVPNLFLTPTDFKNLAIYAGFNSGTATGSFIKEQSGNTYSGEPATTYRPENGYPVTLHPDDPTIYFPSTPGGDNTFRMNNTTTGLTFQRYNGSTWDNIVILTPDGIGNTTVPVHNITTKTFTVQTTASATAIQMGSDTNVGYVDVYSPYQIRDSGTAYLQMQYSGGACALNAIPSGATFKYDMRFGFKNFLNLYGNVVQLNGDVDSGSPYVGCLLRNAGTGDVATVYNTGNLYWSIGIDNSDNDKFKISRSSTGPGTQDGLEFNYSGGIDYVEGVDNYWGINRTPSNSYRFAVGGNTLVSGVTFSPQQPRARAYRATNQSISATTWTTVALNAENYDVGSDFDSGTYQYTVPYSGYYTMNAQVAFTGVIDAKLCRLAIRVNSSITAYVIQHTGVAGDMFFPVCDQRFLSAGDVVDVQVYHNDTVARTLYGGSHFTFFSISMLG